jgi:hypothetical protein
LTNSQSLLYLSRRELRLGNEADQESAFSI